jgi:eukaryotic-like serine/threonine-protein kinase
MRVGDDPDFTKVLDFGVAKLMEGAAKSSRSALSLTQAGMVFGTPELMSPEQAQPLDPRSDLYSLAATMFAILTHDPRSRSGNTTTTAPAE